ncbi:MAG: 16S rRNA (cytosine(1402)-N(4))-methyltransferase RsmH [Bdellovibrionales bacterium]|nr:16S rRNA (cytosine(1402)-N(4))-methyltransferase RsmH [Bdellovibrionales bacterium]
MSRREINIVRPAHLSVMRQEVIEYICLSSAGQYLDGTFGYGGHAEALLAAGAGQVLGLDQDQSALDAYRDTGSARHDPRLQLRHGRFSNVEEFTKLRDWDGAIIDLGPNSGQLLTAERGFSFSVSGPLDMRMDQSGGVPLEQCLRGHDATSLADALYEATGMRDSRRVARRILGAFEAGELTTTEDLAKLAGPRRGKTHPATEWFLGLRMVVNDELGEIRRGIPALLRCLKPGGRLGVITFHSTEDRVVKQLFKLLAGRCVCEERLCRCPRVETIRWVNRKPLEPSEDELRRNPRARSAKFRCVEKLAPQA